MANTAKIFNNSSKPIVAKEIVSEYTNTVSIVNLMDATVKVTGTVTGNLYVFSGAGTVLEVDVRDKDELLNKKRGKSCCGGVGGTDIFQIAY